MGSPCGPWIPISIRASRFGLENLVANRMIVPSPKPNAIAAAYAKVEGAASSLLGRQKPTSNRPELDRLIAYYAKLNEIRKSWSTAWSSVRAPTIHAPTTTAITG